MVGVRAKATRREIGALQLALVPAEERTRFAIAARACT
jgi:hypothetical protein